MKAYVLDAALVCDFCVQRHGLLDADGPYLNGGGEADCPQHCDICGVFLENPLTEDGYRYVAEALESFDLYGDGSADVIATWREFYT